MIDSLDDFKAFSGDMAIEAQQAVIKESREETGIVIHNPELIHISHCGASVDWDLYYFVSTDFEDTGEHDRDDEGEADMTIDWYTLEAVKAKILSGEMSEDRSVGVLLPWILDQQSR